MKRVVVVLPLTPVTATIGMRPFWPSGNSVSTIASPTGRGLPEEGSKCIRKPGPALTSTITPPWLSSGGEMSLATTSTPAMSRPIMRAASTQRAATSGWTRSVTSVAVPPVLKLALRRISTRVPAGGTESGVKPCSVKHGQGDRVEPDLAQHRGVIVAAARIAVDVVDQLANRRVPVADHVGRLAASGGHHAAADHQQAIIGAGGELLDHDARAFFLRRGVGGHDLLARGQVRGHAAALVAVLRLDDHRHADLLGGFPGVFGVGHRPARGTGTPTWRSRLRVSSLSWAIDSAMAPVRSVSAVRMRRCLAPWPNCTRLSVVEPADGNAARFGGADDRAGARAQADLVGQVVELLDFGGHVERPIVDGGQAQLASRRQAGPRQFLFLVFDDDFVDARFGGLAGAAEADRRAGQAFAARA